MSETYKPPLVEARPKGAYIASTCPYCRSEIEYIKPVLKTTPPPGTAPFQIRCCSCGETYNGPVPKTKKAQGGRTIGSGNTTEFSSFRAV